MRKKATTIYDIARRAGVSPSTVSRVVNGHASVHPELRARVERAMRESRFRPNRVAQGLYHRRSNTIGCLLPDISNPFYAQLYLQLEVGAFEHGYTVFLGNTTSDGGLERAYLHSLVERQIDGLLILGGLIQHPQPTPESLSIVQEVAERLPVVAVNGDLPDVELLASVRSDEEGGMRQLLGYLQERGHRRVALLGGLPDVTSSVAKLRVYREIFPAAPPDWVQFSGLSIQAGEQALSQLLQATELPTAVACANDQVAAGVLNAARRAGLGIPADLSVVGFDDGLIAQIVSPTLTTVNQNYRELGKQTIAALLAGIAGETSPRDIRVPTFLVERESVGPDPGR